MFLTVIDEIYPQNMDYVLILRKSANPLNEERENARTFPRKIIIVTSLTQIFCGVFAAILRVSTI